MTDRKKVIKGLEKLREYADSEVHPILSPDNWGIYSELRDLIDEAEEDALTLLKVQEPVKPVVDIDTWKCGNCGHILEHQQLLGDNVLFHEQYNFCPECGRAVRWE